MVRRGLLVRASGQAILNWTFGQSSANGSGSALPCNFADGISRRSTFRTRCWTRCLTSASALSVPPMRQSCAAPTRIQTAPSRRRCSRRPMGTAPVRRCEAGGGKGWWSIQRSHGQDRQNAVPRFSPGLGRHHKGYLCLSLRTSVPLCLPLPLPTTLTPASQTHPHPLPLPVPHTITCTRTCTHMPMHARRRAQTQAANTSMKHTCSLVIN